MLYFLNTTNITANRKQDKATYQRIFDKHRKLVHQHRTQINAKLSSADQKGIDSEKEKDLYKKYLEKLSEMDVGYFNTSKIFCLC